MTYVIAAIIALRIATTITMYRKRAILDFAAVSSTTRQNRGGNNREGSAIATIMNFAAKPDGPTT